MSGRAGRIEELAFRRFSQGWRREFSVTSLRAFEVRA
jgi:hypothetical protein